jgi:Contractile injection system tape measure protein
MLKKAIRHQIQRVVFDFQYSDEATAFGSRKKLEAKFFSDFLPVLEGVLDQHAQNGQSYHIPRVEIDLGSMDPERVDVAELIEILHRQLAQQLSQGLFQDAQALASPLCAADTLFHFLRNGTWPSPTVFSSVAELEEAVISLFLLESAEVLTRLSSILALEESSLRLVYQFNLAFVDRIIDQLLQRLERTFTFEFSRVRDRLGRVTVLKGKAWIIQNLALVISQDLTTEEETKFKQTFDLFLQEKEDQVLLEGRGLFAHQIANDKKKKNATLAIKVSSEFKEEVKAGVYTPYAGIVLLHPFLCRFFESLNLLNSQNQFKDEDAQRHAIHMFHFLASGMENPEEPQASLLKVICGYTLEAPLDRVRTLGDMEKEEAQSLLLAVIGHWSSLKNTSPDGFRQEFLQREGKLETRDSVFHLTVEQRSIDVLLPSLPWSFSIIRLPWMKGPLRVDWA